MQILMSDGIEKNPSQTLVHDGFFSSYSVFGKFSVKTGRLLPSVFFVALIVRTTELSAVRVTSVRKRNQEISMKLDGTRKLLCVAQESA